MPRNKLLSGGLVAIAWLGIWAAAAAYVAQPLLLPSPMQTARALWTLAGQKSFWLAVGASMGRILLGFSLGLASGAALAVVTCRFAWCHAFFAPFLAVVKATPVASFIMLALVWLHTGSVPVLATVLVVLPIAWANLSAGIRAVDADLLEMARGFRVPRMGVLRGIYWPTVRPYLRAAIATGMGMAWKGGVAAEVIATPRGSLGSYLHDAKVYLETPNLFAVTAVVIALSMLLEALVMRGMGREKGGAADA